MCGIAGWISAEPLPAARAQAQLAVLLQKMRYRGPDGEGTAVALDGRVGFAHTRLAIIDPNPRSDQPLRDAATGAFISFNGEIYNYNALRAELMADGASFATTGDSEVILRGYLRDGLSFFSRLRGMYAFALFDPRSRTVIALRDPLGIKPLYVSMGADRVGFASSPEAALAPDAPLTLDPAAAVSVAVMGAALDPLSPYLGVEQALPGVAYCISAPGETLSIATHPIEPAFDWTGGPAEPDLDRLGTVLGDSVAAHFTSDVPVAIFQSAGLDSSLISALAKHQGCQPTLLTIGFDEFRGALADEVVGAADLAQGLGFEHRAVYLTRDDFEGAKSAFLADMTTPTADGFNTYLAARFCHEQGFKVALSGVGGDELCAGYPSFKQLPRLDGLAMIARVPGGRALLRGASEMAWRGNRRRSPKLRYLADYLDTMPSRYLLRRAYFAPNELCTVLAPEVIKAGLPRFLESFRALSKDHTASDEASVRALELDVYMRNVLLRDCDWAGMAHAVEVRTPLVDVALLRQLCDERLRCGVVKSDLRRLMERLIPGLTLPQRPKTGFLVPHDAWSAAPDGKPVDPLAYGSRGPRAWNRQVLKRWFGDWALA